MTHFNYFITIFIYNFSIDHATTMTYEKILPYINNPYWKSVRKISLILVGIFFFILFFAACIRSVIAFKSSTCIHLLANLNHSMTNNNVASLTPSVNNQISSNGG